MIKKQEILLERLNILASAVKALSSRNPEAPISVQRHEIVLEAIETLNWTFNRPPSIREVAGYIIDHGNRAQVKKIARLRKGCAQTPNALREYLKKRYELPEKNLTWRERLASLFRQTALVS